MTESPTSTTTTNHHSRFPRRNARRTKSAKERSTRGGKVKDDDAGHWQTGIKKLWKKSTKATPANKKEPASKSHVSRQKQEISIHQADNNKTSDSNPSLDQVQVDLDDPTTHDLKVLLQELGRFEDAVAKVEAAEKKLLEMMDSRHQDPPPSFVDDSKDGDFSAAEHSEDDNTDAHSIASDDLLVKWVGNCGEQRTTHPKGGDPVQPKCNQLAKPDLLARMTKRVKGEIMYRMAIFNYNVERIQTALSTPCVQSDSSATCL